METVCKRVIADDTEDVGLETTNINPSLVLFISTIYFNFLNSSLAKQTNKL
jgi:hypothetical protein